MKYTRKQALSHFWSLVVLIVVVVATLSAINLEDIRNLLIQVDVDWALAGAGFYLTAHLLRAIRLGQMLEEAAIPLLRLICWSGLHAVWNYLLPARTGELSLVVYLERYEKQAAAKVTAVLITVRGLEMILTLLLVILILIPFDGIIRPQWKIVILIGVLSLLAVITFGARKIMQKEITQIKEDKKDGIWYKLKTFLVQVWAHLQASLKSPKRNSVMILTLLIWCFNIGMYYTLFPALGKQIPVAIVITIVIGIAFAQITPIQSFLSVGSHEIIWVPVLTASGLAFSDAVSFAVSSHLIILCYVLGFAVLLTGVRLGVRR